ncbi:MAG: helix-turn-helix domain-containing protein [Rhodopseudomonas sp.]|nr:helix-turn-helix domain-containing protein [Rhodopseudomonas sp.]
MTPEQFSAALKALGLTQTAAAEFLGRSLRQVSAYANGARIPLATAKLLRLMVWLNLKPSDVQ